ncbi:MAG: 3-oxoacid CoA-transferase subunit B [Deltaproteobacteria bacterium]|nr:3-oxoacid CoA-transferase subunit B [Deltaproteobacteria bacterium]
MNAKEFIAKRVALELNDGDVVNLGIGLPTLVGNFLPEGVQIILQSENGLLGMGPAPEKGKEDYNLSNAGGTCVTALPGAASFDSSTSFAIIRGGHVDTAVVGALEVDEKGTLASHMVPGKMVPGMGGAMDLASGARKMIVAMLHTADGKPKILKKVSLPVTGVCAVDLIVTEKAVIEVTPKGLLLKEIAAGTTAEEVQSLTEAKLIVSPDLKTMPSAA